MNYKEFTKGLRRKVEETGGPDAEVTIHRIPKNNGVKMDALTILMPGETIAPAIYLQEYFLRYKSGETLDALAERMVEKSRELKQQKHFSLKEMKDFQNVQDRIQYRLVNFEMNRELLQTIPFERILDLACIYYYETICPNRETGTILVKNNDLSTWNISLEEIRRIAEKNTPGLSGAEIVPMREMIAEDERDGYESSEDEGDVPMYILTNQKRIYGASCMLYPDVLLPLARKLGANLFILPSSIHEVILTPDWGDISKGDLESTVREINRTQVEPYEVLSDHVYYYDRQERRILM